MLSNDFLTPIFHEENGELNQLFSALPYCTDKMDYAFFKYRHPDVPVTPGLFLNDINIDMEVRAGTELCSLSLSRYDNPLFETVPYDPDPATPMRLIETLLEEGKIILIQTVSKWLPFFKHYDESFDAARFTPGHVFMAVGHAGDELYYIEVPKSIRRENFTPHPDNPELGILKKKVLEKPIQYYLKCFAYREDSRPKEGGQAGGAAPFIRLLLESYQTPSATQGGLAYYQGHGALVKLLELCRAQTLLTNTPVPFRPHLTYCNLFEWQFRSAAEARTLWKLFFQQEPEKHQGILEALDESVICWEIVKNTIQKNEFRGQVVLDRSYLPHFEHLLQSEERLMACFQKLLEGERNE